MPKYHLKSVKPLLSEKDKMLKYEYDALFIFVWFVLVCVCLP